MKEMATTTLKDFEDFIAEGRGMKRTTTIEEYNDEGKMVKRTVTEEDGAQDIKYVPQPMPMPTAPAIPWWNDKVWCGVDTGRNPVPFNRMMSMFNPALPPDPRGAEVTD